MLRSQQKLALVLVLGTLGTGSTLNAQQSLSRRAAVDAAMTRGPLAALLAADTARASADLAVAGVRFLPLLQITYTGAAPQYHVVAELPLDGMLLQSRRLGVARAAQRSVRFQFAFNRARLAFDADTAYTRALAAAARFALARRNASDADSLRRIAEARRDAGDASELDVQLATITAGQTANLAAIDSNETTLRLLDLQSLIGLYPDSIRISLSDSLAPLALGTWEPRTPGVLRVAAAASALGVAQAQLALDKHARFGTPSVFAGVEKGDPSRAQPQALPTIGFALPIPFPRRNRGVVQVAEAERSRAAATLAVVRLESARQTERALRERGAAAARVGRTGLLVAVAERVAALALTAYREGASPLPYVLEARRNARDIMVRYIDDLAALLTADAVVTLVTMTEGT